MPTRLPSPRTARALMAVQREVPEYTPNLCRTAEREMTPHGICSRVQDPGA